MKRLIVCAFMLAVSATHPAVAGPPVPPMDDNGDASFVRQIVPKLLGRKPRGTEEVVLLADIVALKGREAVVRMLLETSEFSDHQAATLADQLKAQRETGLAQTSSCFENTMPFEPGVVVVEGAEAVNLAEFVRDNDITSNYHRTFNMYELIRSAIEIDNVFPVYRAYLYALGHKVKDGNNMLDDEGQRRLLGASFDDVFLGRNLECMTCHNSKAAVTDYKGNHHPLYRGLDPAMYDHLGAVVPPIDTEAVPGYAACVGCHGSAGQGGSGPTIQGKTAEEIQLLLDNPGPGMALDWSAVTWTEIQQIADALRDPGPFASANLAETTAKHFAVFRRDFFHAQDDDAPIGWGPWGISTDCAAISNQGQNEGPIPAFFAGIESDYASVADVDQSFTEGYQDLPSAHSIEGHSAFAYMVAAKITENVWKQLMGEPLTVVNYYARNTDQWSTHKYLTELVFIANDWSLKELIVAIMELRFWNRRAPIASLLAGPYVLPPMWEPFVPEDTTCRDEPDRRDEIDDLIFRSEPDPRDTPVSLKSSGGGPNDRNPDRDLDLTARLLCGYNGQGDLVHRYAPRHLFNAVGSALDWPTPKLFPNSQYPGRDLQVAVGQYLSSIDAGFVSVDFQSLLNWDDAHGRCDKQKAGVSEDWVDALIDAIDVFNQKNPNDPITLFDVAMTLKDWLIQEPTLGGYLRPSGTAPDDFVWGEVDPIQTESDAIEVLFGLSLDENITSDSIAEPALRELCGVYLRSPQFMLAGIIRNDTFQAPRLRVCNDGPCSYLEMCDAYAPFLQKAGFNLTCSSDLPLAGSSTPGEPVPEPAFWLTFVPGLALLSLLARRRQSRQSRRILIVEQ